jgi:multiple sugar transport system permease protein
VVNSGGLGRWGRMAAYVWVWLCCLLFAIPAIWSVSNSLRELDSAPKLFHTDFSWINYKYAVTLIDFWKYFGNSLTLAAISVIIGVFMSGVVGFAFARLYAPGKNVLFIIVLSTMMLPGIVIEVPTYILFTRIHLIDSFLPWVIWALGGSPFVIFLFRQFFSTIPRELEDAARMDGCSTLRIFWSMFIPLSIPAMVTAAIIKFQWAWGDYMRPFMFLTDSKYPLAIALMNKSYTFPTDPYQLLEPVVSSAALIFSIPVLITFFVGQRFLTEGIVSSGLKG